MKMLLVGLLLFGTIVYGGPCDNSNGDSSGDYERAHSTTVDELKNAVAQYASENLGNLPELTGTYSVAECIDCHIVDINALLASNGGIFSTVPDGCYETAGSDNDNCDGGANGCSSSFHYVWLMDEYGNVYSKCMGTDCDSNNATGYQGVWP